MEWACSSPYGHGSPCFCAPRRGLLDAVTSDDVARVASDLITSDRLRLAVIGPFDDASRFDALLDA